ncbi:hypothetical protein A2U01_0036352 [Trifolium medium]|uniref:Calmodulin binding protein C-terminal domain-containing protein n=1 Tax=Trifolium medium TaxID=97028 RepID=A0A392PV76_9FABA|nr:hypothetical protein [Trifolium medium]
MVKAAYINGQTIPNRDINNMNRGYIEKLVREAHARWNDLEEIDEVLNDNVALLTQGETVEQFQNNIHQAPVITYDQNEEFFGDKSIDGGNYVASHNNNAQIGCIQWSPPHATTPFMNGILSYSFSDLQSDGGDIMPSTSRWH